VMHVVRFILHFFWHGCVLVVLLAILWFVLHYLKVF
jgi:hypothetical protein